MKICHIITAFGFGGAEKLLTDLVNIQVETNEIHIVYLKGAPLLQPEVNSRVHFHKVGLGMRCAADLRKLIKTLGPDIVHTHLGHADLIGLWAVRHLSLKRFCTMHNIWFKWNWTDRVIFLIYRIFFKTIARDCKVIAISKSVAYHVEMVLGVKRKNVVILYNAIRDIQTNEKKEDLRKEFGIPTSSFCILFVGRLEKQKSVDTLIEAAQRLRKEIPNLYVLIIGEGTLRETLQEQIKEFKLSESIFLAGTKNRIDRYFAASDVFVLPSVFEGFGIVIIEAFRASVPVIATNIEGPKELIENNLNGLLFEPKHVEGLAERINDLYKSSEKRTYLAQKGHKTYFNNFNIENYANKINSLYVE